MKKTKSFGHQQVYLNKDEKILSINNSSYRVPIHYTFEDLHKAIAKTNKLNSK